MMAQQSVVMVTGALTGIGRATASAFARRGDVVVVSGRHDDVGEQLARELKGLGAHDSLFVRADVAFERDVADLVDDTVQHFGRVDVAVNNAGTEGRRAPITELTATAYAETFGANVLGTLLSMKHELRVMQGQGRGAIVNLASIHGGKGLPNLALYAASKQAVIGLTRTAALEAASFGVWVNAVGAEHIDTMMFAQVVSNTDNQAAATGAVRQGRAGRHEEIAEAILFLTGEQESFLTGQTLFIGGGVKAD
jgi:NAD(P)-dependent dehydrogenase (short-subunit alcohol dehydrogenase family)